MGSVKGAKSAGVSVGPGAGGVNWERLHGPVVKGFGGGGRRGGWTERRSVEQLRDGEEEDDGSGLAWVRKRKERRAREAKEKTEDNVVSSEDPNPTPEPKSKPKDETAPTNVRNPSLQSVVENEENDAEHRVLHAVSSVRMPMSPQKKQTVGHRKVPEVERPATVNSPSEGESEGSSDTTESDSEEEESGEAEIGEEEATEKKRRTALGAGVEKVSRHRE